MPWFTVIDKIGAWINQNYFSSCCSLYHQSFCLHILNQCHVIFQKQIICDKKHQGKSGMLAKLAEMLLAFSINSLCIYANNCDIVSDPKTRKHYQDNLL